MVQRNWYLNQLGITQYVLRRPKVLQGESAIIIDKQTRLIVVSDSPPQEKIFFDILAAIKLSSEHVLHLTEQQLEMLPDDIKPVIWLIDSNMPKEWQSKPISFIITPSLEIIAQSPQHKRQLWLELCRYESNFHPNY